MGALLIITLENQLSGVGSWINVAASGFFIMCVLFRRRSHQCSIDAICDAVERWGRYPLDWVVDY